MLRNYIKIGFRNLVKQKVYSLINILGLSVGIASVMIILLHVEDETSYDKFHDKGDNIYKVFLERIYPDHITKYATIPHSFSEVMVTDFDEVENAARISNFLGELAVTYDNEEKGEKTVFEEDGFLLADSTFFSIFSVNILKGGDPNEVLRGPQDLVITEDMAIKYFGDEDPINKVLQAGQNFTFTVRAVCENIPDNSHFDFDFLASLKIFPFFQNPNFMGFSSHTYVQLNENANPRDLELKFPEMVKTYAGPQVEQNLNTTFDEYVAAGNGYNYSLVNIQDIHLNPTKYEGQMKPGGSSTYVYIFISTAILILVIACINFMNLATARSTERAREVGVRKTMGSIRSQLISQFLTESVIISLVSMVVAIVSVYITLPYFNTLAGKQLVLFESGSLVIPFVVGFSIFVGLLAGSYPSFVLSNFNPATVLKGQGTPGKGKSILRNGLVVFQFLVSIILIVGTMVVQKQMKFVQNMDLGFDRENMIVIERSFLLGDQSQSFMDELKTFPNVIGVGGSTNMPGSGYVGIQFQAEGSSEVYTANSSAINDGYAENIGFTILEGRSFSKDTKDSLNILVNSQMKNLLGFEDVIGRKLVTNFNNQEVSLEIIGVVEDYNYMSVKEKISPFVLMNTEFGFGNPPPLISVRVSDNYQEVLADIEARWDQIVPERPLKYTFFDDNLQEQYLNEANSGKLLAIFAGLAILIACVGLFGLAAYTAGLRTKEIGVRKVMGASVGNVVVMLSKEFTVLILIALVPAIPISWYAMDKWLENFAYKTSIGADIFIIAGLSALAIAWLTVSYQSIKAAVVNPVKSLRSE